jgi:hypothetical protein
MRPLFLLPLALLLAACDGGGPDPNPPVEPEVVDGVNLTALLAPPTNAERAAIRAEWPSLAGARAARYAYTVEATVEAADGADLVVYAGRDAASQAVLHYGFVRLPPRPPGDVARRPAVLVLPEDAAALTPEAALATLPLEGSVVDEFVYVALAYRGQALDVGGTTYASPPDPAAAYDLDAEDARAFFDAALARTPLADPARTAAVGYGRGGTAALLAEARGGPFDLVASLAAPTSFFLSSARDAAHVYLSSGAPGALPAFDDVAATVLDPLRGGGGDVAAARLALLRRSPAFFAGPPPFILAAHGVLDFVVPVAHGDALGLVQGEPEAVYLRRDEDDHASLVGAQEVVSTATGLFLDRVLDPP